MKQNKFYLSHWDDYTTNNIWCMKWNADLTEFSPQIAQAEHNPMIASSQLPFP